jgi:hypothetical protein
MKEITLTATGPTGSGKSALLGEIEITLRALNLPYRYADEQKARVEKNMTGADWVAELEAIKPSVVLVEGTPRTEKLEKALSELENVTADGLRIYKAVVRAEAIAFAYEQAALICDTVMSQCEQIAAATIGQDMNTSLVAKGGAFYARKLGAAMRELGEKVK